MQSIEVRKGTSQIRFGPHTTGGVINYVATEIPDQTHAYLNTSFGTNQTLRNHAYAGTSWDTSSGRWGALVEWVGERSEGFKELDNNNDPNYPGTDDTGYTRNEGLVRLSWEPTSEIYQRVEIMLGGTHTDANLSYLGLTEADFAQNPFRRYASTRMDNFEGTVQRGSVRYTIDPHDNLSFTTTVYCQHFERDWFKLQALRNIDIGSGTVIGAMDLSVALTDDLGKEALRGERAATLRYRHNDREYENCGIMVDGWPLIEQDTVEHELQFGVRWHQDSERRFQQDIDFDQDNNGHIIAENPVSLPGFAGNRLQETTAIALYAEDHLRFDNWQVTLGGRIEFLDYYYDIRAPETPASGEDELVVFSGGIGAAYQINHEWTVFGDVFRGVSTPTPQSYIRDNTSEETSLGFELGSRWQPDHLSDTRVEVIGFATWFNDLLVIDNVGGTGTGNSENVGKIRSIGAEIAARTDLGTNAQWSFKNPWRLAVTLTDARLDGNAASADAESIFAGGDDGNKAPYIPTAVISLNTDLIWQHWGLSLSMQYQAETFTTASNSNSITTPSGDEDARYGRTDDYFLVDIQAWYQSESFWRIYAGVDNVFDQSYVASRHPHGPRPGQPLLAYGGIQLEY